jgi:hypothetical protein
MPGGDLTLEYYPLASDQTINVATGSSYDDFPSPFLARSATGSFVHANIFVALRDGNGRNVSFRHRLWRRWRIWDVATDNLVVPVAPKPVMRWTDDNRGGGGWIDAPGRAVTPGGGAAAMAHSLNEFVIFRDGAEKISAGIFYAVLHSIGRGKYRVQSSSGAGLDWTKWLALESSLKPAVATLGCSVAVDSGWLSFAG